MAGRKTARNLLWRAINLCSGARWHSLDQMVLALPQRRVGPLDPIPELLLLIQARARRRLSPADPFHGGRAPEVWGSTSPIALQVELAFQELQLAEQRLLLADDEAARLHCRRFVHGLLAAAVEVLGQGLIREEQELILGTARHLPSRLASQLELRQALRARSLPSRMIFILGMHRSGTSALSGLLSQAGLDAPADLMPPDAVNPRGYWESQGLYVLNDELLCAFGSRWGHPEILPQGWEDCEEVILWRRNVLRHLCEMYAGAEAPVIKDPRLCILLPALTPWLESGILRTEILLTLRDPLEVACSLEKAQNVPHQEGLRLWLQYVFAAERLSRGYSRLLLRFDDLIRNPGHTLERCLAMLARENDGSGSDVRPCDFVSPELHRQRRELLDRDLHSDGSAIATTRELALMVYALLTERELNEPETAARMDFLAAHLRLLPEKVQGDRNLI